MTFSETILKVCKPVKFSVIFTKCVLEKEFVFKNYTDSQNYNFFPP